MKRTTRHNKTRRFGSDYHEAVVVADDLRWKGYNSYLRLEKDGWYVDWTWCTEDDFIDIQIPVDKSKKCLYTQITMEV